jgi:hypothetical protein
MPFSSQPRKKGKPGPQEDVKKSACGHTISKSNCPECIKQVTNKSVPNNVVDLPTEKKRLSIVQEKLANQFATDKRAAEKAAFILSDWINGKNKKSK